MPADRVREHGRVGALVRIDSDDHHGLVSVPSTGRVGPELPGPGELCGWDVGPAPWEFLRLDETIGMSVWWRDHADHCMSVLLSADGPFKGCSPDGG